VFCTRSALEYDSNSTTLYFQTPVTLLKGIYATLKQAQPTNCIRVEFWQQHLLLLSHLHFLLWHFNENLNN